MNKDGCEFVKTVEDKAVLPDHNGHHEDAHAEDIVGLEPDQAVGEEENLEQHGDVHEVAKVQHEQMVIALDILNVSRKCWSDLIT